MAYDFTTLSPDDFEHLICDLFSADWGAQLEVFTPGKDGGEIRVHNAKGEEALYTVEAKPSGAKGDPFGTGVNGSPEELDSRRDEMSTDITNDN